MDINITDLRIASTIGAFITFIAIWVWAWSKPKRDDFDEAANLPFEGEE